MKCIEAQVVFEKLTIPACIDLMRSALMDLDSGSSTMPVRSGMGLAKGGLAFMPASLGAQGVFGAKVLSVYPANARDGYPSHQGYVMLFDEMHGTPLALADAAAITEIRTGCVSALATDLLANKNASRCALIGAGRQARSHAAAIAHVRNLEQFVLYDLRADAATECAKEIGALTGVPVKVAKTVQDAVAGADILCTLTPSKTPLITRDMLRAGMHINAVGACSACTREIAGDAVAASLLYCDQMQAIQAGGGEYMLAVAEGAIAPEHLLGTLGGVARGTVQGRRFPQDITLFKALGLAVEDIACALYLHQNT